MALSLHETASCEPTARGVYARRTARVSPPPPNLRRDVYAARVEADRTLTQKDALGVEALWMRRDPSITWSDETGNGRDQVIKEKVIVGTAPSSDIVLVDRAVS